MPWTGKRYVSVVFNTFFSNFETIWFTKFSVKLYFLKVCSLDDLEDGKEYVCSGKGDNFKRIEYSKTDTLRTKRLANNLKLLSTSASSPKIVAPDCVRPRIVTIIRNGIKPRKVGGWNFENYRKKKYFVLRF